MGDHSDHLEDWHEDSEVRNQKGVTGNACTDRTLREHT